MPAGKRKYGKVARMKAKNNKKLAKKKKNKNPEADWYTSDSMVGMFNDLGDSQKKKRRKVDRNEWLNQQLNGENDQPVDHGSSEEEEEEDLEEAPDHYSQLVATLVDSTDLDKKERRVLKRIRREQEGLEEDSGEEDDSDDSDEDDDNEKSEEVDQGGNEAEEEAGGEIEENRVIGKEDSELDGEGSIFQSRFVDYYKMNDDDLDSEATRKALVEKSKDKVQIGEKSYMVTKYGADRIPSKLKEKFVPEKIDTEESSGVLNRTYEIKERLGKQWLAYALRRDKLCKRRLGPEVVPLRNKKGFTNLQTDLAGAVFNYCDLLFSGRSLENASELRELYVLHILNHIFKSHDMVTKHNSRLRMKKHQEREKRDKARLLAAQKGSNLKVLNDEAEKNEEDEDNTFRDQGFTRPKVLIMVPNRLAALRVVRLMLELLPSNVAVANKTKFWDEFSEAHDEGLDKEAEARAKRERSDASESYDELYYQHNKHFNQFGQENMRRPLPADWQDVFKGNHDEAFRMGIAVANRKSFRLFSDFYRSDIILASPLGLRMSTNQDIGDAAADPYSKDDLNENEEEEEKSTGNKDRDEIDRLLEADKDPMKELGFNIEEEETRAAQKEKKEDVDFLSSIELCVLDQSDVMEMQNWQHVQDSFAALNRKPFALREDMDFERVRSYFLVDGLARRFRQTLVFSQFPHPLLSALVVPKTTMRLNFAGMLCYRPAKYDGSLLDVSVEQVGHKFVRVPTASISADDAKQQNDDDDDDEAFEDPRLEYFEKNILKSLTREEAAHTMVLVPSYLDYISLRRLFRKAAAELGESGSRAKGKPWKGMSGKTTLRFGKRVKRRNEATPALFVCVSEYSETQDVSRARSDFFVGRARVLLTTERFYFYHRYRLRGVHRIVFYSPPLHPHFYSELCNLIEPSATSDENGVTRSSGSGPIVTNLTLFDSSDMSTLERIVGTYQVKKMIARPEKMVFDVSFS